MIALVLSNIVVNTNQCSWYFVSYFLDTFLGVALAYFLLKLLTKIAINKNWDRLIESGDYGETGDNKEILKTWGAQLFAWIIIIIISRLFTGIILVIFREGFSDIANGIASFFNNDPKMLLLFVMIICPGIMNLAQVWVQDNILKKTHVIDRSILSNQLLNNDGIDGIGDNEL